MNENLSIPDVYPIALPCYSKRVVSLSVSMASEKNEGVFKKEKYGTNDVASLNCSCGCFFQSHCAIKQKTAALATVLFTKNCF